MITDILWDLDGTLLDFSKGMFWALRQTLRPAGVPPTQETMTLYADINDDCWKRLERGELTRVRLRTERFEKLFAALGVSADVHSVARNYSLLLGKAAFFVPGAYELCAALRSRYRQYVVTNGDVSTSGNKLRLSGFDRLMNACFISEQMGVDKPSAQFFERCFAAIPAFRREQAVIVGDSLTSDMLGGRNAGIRCIWYDPHGQPAPDETLFDARIGSLDELPAVLERM